QMFLTLEKTWTRKIQEALLPKTLPDVHGLEIAAMNNPAQELGGDLYDVIPIDDDHLGFAIADVSGKGIIGGLFMCICREIVEGMRDEPGIAAG
ncbi:MAG TPA: hypothetical protein PKX94_05005, partial [Opitutales bacterium]|nr:hypothetical protein [Opitutales bacterium]